MNDDANVAKTISGRQVAWGFGIAMILHLVLLLTIPLMALFGSIGEGGQFLVGVLLMAGFNPGATQFLYEIPLLIHFHRHGEAGKARGVLIAMALTILLNGACWVALETGKFRIAG